MRDDLDKDLLQMFEEKNLELPEEPFRAELRLRIEKARIGYDRVYWILTALALAACAAAANFVIGGVSLFLGELNRVLQNADKLLAAPIGFEFLAVPAGFVVVAAAALISLLFRRRVLSMFV